MSVWVDWADNDVDDTNNKAEDETKNIFSNPAIRPFKPRMRLEK